MPRYDVTVKVVIYETYHITADSSEDAAERAYANVEEDYLIADEADIVYLDEVEE